MNVFKFDSADRTYGSSSDFNMTLKSGVDGLEGKYRVEMVSIPVSWYNVNSSNNGIGLYIGGVLHNLSLGVGYYNGSELCAGLKVLFESVGGGAVFGVSFEAQTKKLNVSCDTPFELRVSSVDSGVLLGFGVGEFASVVSGGSNVVISSYIPNLSPIDTIAINFRGMADAVSLSNGYKCNILVPIGSQFGSMNIFEFEHPPVLSFINKTRSFDVSITDARTGRVIDLNGQNWWITLRLV